MRTPPDPTLAARYAEPHRRYHTLAHVEACLALLDEVSPLDADSHRILELALWWHDAVYDPMRSDNEAQSAELARRALEDRGEDRSVVDEIERLILLTRGHRVESGDGLGALMVSIDLAILGAEPAAYDAYAAAIREEYVAVPEPLYRAGRARILASFLDADTIFADPAFRARLEQLARKNLAREIATLSSQA